MSLDSTNDINQSDQERIFTDLFWDLIYGEMGFRQCELDSLRIDANNLSNRRPFDSNDLIKETKYNDDWTDANDIEQVRNKLKEYLEILEIFIREKKNRNELKFKTKSFVDDKRYATLRAKEAKIHFTSTTVFSSIKKLNLSERCISIIDPGIEKFCNLCQLVISQNPIKIIHYLPDKLKVLIANGCSLKNIDPPICQNLVFLSISNNSINSLIFLQQMPFLTFLDATYNQISSFNDNIFYIKTSQLKELLLSGNPISFHPNYRNKILDSTQNILVLDEMERNEKFLGDYENKQNLVIQIKLNNVRGIDGIIPQQSVFKESVNEVRPKSKTNEKTPLKSAANKISITQNEPIATPPPRPQMTLKGAWLKNPEVDFFIENIVPTTPEKSQEMDNQRTTPKAKKRSITVEFIPRSKAPEEYNISYIKVVDIPINDNLVDCIFEPLVIDVLFGFSDTLDNADRIGFFVIPTHGILEQLQWSQISFKFDAIPMEIDPIYVNRHREIEERKRLSFKDLLDRDNELNNALEEMEKKYNQSKSAMSAVSHSQKKGQSSGKAKNVEIPVPEPLQQARAEALKRKQELEIMSESLIDEEKKIEAIIENGGKIFIEGSIEINPPPKLLDIIKEEIPSPDEKNMKLTNKKKNQIKKKL